MQNKVKNILPKIGGKKVLGIMLLTLTSVLSIIIAVNTQKYITFLKTQASDFREEKNKTEENLLTISKQFEDLKNQDQYLVNQKLNENLDNIKKTYSQAVSVYEDLLKLKEKTKTSEELDDLFANAISLLSQQDFAGAKDKLNDLSAKIAAEEEKLIAAAASAVPLANVPQSNTPPQSGYSRQNVTTSAGTFLVSIVSADLGSTRVIVDTASGGDCSNDCPVLSLADYVARNNAFAGVNGSYFCPASYPSCAGKTNSFDTLLMNKNKVYFNSDNNVYSTVPAVIFGNGWIRFVGQSLEWGRDTSIDSMLANQGLLVHGGNITFGGNGDPKKGSLGNRSFVANKGNTIYIGVIHSATVAQSAIVMHTLGMENALNLDDGGSTALWSGGYRVGPGRALPNVILFVRK